MDKYRYHFDPATCDRPYFRDLERVLNRVDPATEDFRRMSRTRIDQLNLRCTHPLRHCHPDETFFDNKKQILLGRAADTIPCMGHCHDHYFVYAMETYSLFKNDVFIRYMMERPEVFIRGSRKRDLETVFPIRILLSTKHDIPAYTYTKMNHLNEYTHDTLKNVVAVSPANLRMLRRLPRTSRVKRRISNSSIISRELCLLHQMKLHFYVLREPDGTNKPFILVSKYTLPEIRAFYRKYGKPCPDIHPLFDPKRRRSTAKARLCTSKRPGRRTRKAM